MRADGREIEGLLKLSRCQHVTSTTWAVDDSVEHQLLGGGDLLRGTTQFEQSIQSASRTRTVVLIDVNKRTRFPIDLFDVLSA